MGTSGLALERVQALLKVDSGSGSLHDHLCRVIRKVVEEKPDDALASLEALSRHLKQSASRAPNAPDQVVPSVADPEAEKAVLKWCSDVMKLVGPSSIPAPIVQPVVRNFMEDAAMFSWAGVGFGKLESYQIYTSLFNLADQHPTLVDLRFWGKVLGSAGDYYVAEGTLPESKTPADKPAPTDPEAGCEPRGVGVNEKDYWVCSSPLSPWVRLPSARADQLVAARSVKRLMTGDLASEVLTMPWFPGKEIHLLRCQIARISAATTVAVAGWYEQGGEGEAGGKLAVAESALEAFPSTEELESQEKWVHCRPEICFNGKTAWPLPDDFTDEQVAEREEAEHNNEYNMAAPILREIRADKRQSVFSPFPNKPEGAEGDDGETSPAWSVKAFGDNSVYDFGEDKPRSNRVTAVRSLLWPGAITVAQGTKFANLYVGYGMKCGTLVPPMETGEPTSGSSAFWPLCPADIMDEPVDHEEADEPHPLEDEADSDGRESMDNEEES